MQVQCKPAVLSFWYSKKKRKIDFVTGNVSVSFFLLEVGSVWLPLQCVKFCL